MAREIWKWYISRESWLTASHIPWRDNIVVDRASNVFDDTTEWKLADHIYNRNQSLLGQSDIDMFGSRLNFHITPYVLHGFQTHMRLQ